MNVLAVGAHPDDIEYGAGGTSARLAAAGHRVWWYVASLGERGGDPEVRRAELNRATDLLGVTLAHVGKWPDTEVPRGADLIHALEDDIGIGDIDTVLVNVGADTHQDHQAVAHATLAAARRVPTVLTYDAPSSLRPVNGTVYVDISAVLPLKLAALRAHASQARARLPETADAEARFWGSRLGVVAAEAFAPVRLRWP